MKNTKENQSKKNTPQSGKFYSINTIKVKGHKGQLRRMNKNGQAKAIIVTHAPYTRNKKNIKLRKNPQGKLEDSYVLIEPETIKTKKHLGKYQDDMIVIDPVDKSIFRHISKK